MLFVGSMLALALTLFVMSPFWLGRGGLLLPSSNFTDPKKIKRINDLIIERYVKEKQAHEQGFISKDEWQKRKQYLTNRFLDLSKRLDYLTFISQEKTNN